VIVSNAAILIAFARIRRLDFLRHAAGFYVGEEYDEILQQVGEL